MTNQEAADELQYAINLIKQDGKDWLDERDIPILEAAISALQAQDSPKPTAESAQNVPKEDLISRKAAIDAMSESLKRVFPEHRQIAEKCLKALPPAQPEPQWIPVSERLPEEGQSILVTADGWRMVAIIRTFFKDMHKDIIAWMPLPEPYRVERRTDEAN